MPQDRPSPPLRSGGSPALVGVCSDGRQSVKLFGSLVKSETDSAGTTLDDNKVERQWPDPMDDSAFSGYAGAAAQIMEPHTEADPAALLVQMPVGLGNI